MLSLALPASASADDGERIYVPGQPQPEQAEPEQEPDELPEIYVAELRPGGRGLAGVDFGIGIMDPVCGGCSSLGGVGLNLFGGYQLVRRVAILAELAGLFHLLPTDGERSSGGLLTHGSATAAARVWLLPRLWLQAGGGVAVLTNFGDNSADKAWSPAIRMAVGGEPGHKPHGGIDISLHLTGAVFRLDEPGRVPLYDAVIMVGYHWN